jgi:hypothetical protein
VKKLIGLVVLAAVFTVTAIGCSGGATSSKAPASGAGGAGAGAGAGGEKGKDKAP